jgi:hypothetical protein
MVVNERIAVKFRGVCPRPITRAALHPQVQLLRRAIADSVKKLKISKTNSEKRNINESLTIPLQSWFCHTV